jgi:cytochrome c oxidase subunit 2
MTDAMLSNMFNILADEGGTFWQPPQASTIAPDVDWLFNFIMGVCVFFFLLVLILLVVFAWKYRYREGQPMLDAPKHNTALELTWTFVPTVIVVIIFFYGFKGFINMAIPPQDTYEVVASARMWSYTFRYPNNAVDNQLHIPINQPIQIVLSSDDVIHGFYIPAFRIKKDDVPGRYNKIWIKANTLGTYDIFCTQYCGQGHSTMRAKVVVQSPDDFNKYLAEVSGGNLTPVEMGKHIWETRGCNQCHTIDGSAGKCPTWKDVFGSTITFKDGTSMVADENYLHLVITQPNIKPMPGFDPMMPPTAGLLTDKDVDAVIAFIKTLSSHYHPVPAALSATQPSPTK